MNKDIFRDEIFEFLVTFLVAVQLLIGCTQYIFITELMCEASELKENTVTNGVENGIHVIFKVIDIKIEERNTR